MHQGSKKQQTIKVFCVIYFVYPLDLNKNLINLLEPIQMSGSEQHFLWNKIIIFLVEVLDLGWDDARYKTICILIHIASRKQNCGCCISSYCCCNIVYKVAPRSTSKLYLFVSFISNLWFVFHLFWPSCTLLALYYSWFCVYIFLDFFLKLKCYFIIFLSLSDI